MKSNILSIINDACFSCSNIFVTPDIPYKKIVNAIEAYATEISSEDILLLVDDTVFGGAKDGLIITSKMIFCRENPFSGEKSISFEEIKNIAYEKKEIFINDKKFLKIHTCDHANLEKLFRVISEIKFLFSKSDKNLQDKFEINENNARIFSKETETSEKLNEQKKQKVSNLFWGIKTYYEKTLHKKLILNALDAFFDASCAISVEQNNKSWGRDSFTENSIEKCLTEFSCKTISLAISIQDLPRHEGDCDIADILLDDKITYEVICYLLSRSMLLVNNIKNTTRREEILAFLTEDIYMKRIFFPYETICLNKNKKGIHSLDTIELRDTQKNVLSRIKLMCAHPDDLEECAGFLEYFALRAIPGNNMSNQQYELFRKYVINYGVTADMKIEKLLVNAFS